MRLDTIVEPVVGRRVRDVKLGICLAGTTGEEADDTSLAVSDDGTGITRSGEGAVLVTVRIDGQLHRRLVSVVLEVFADERHNASSAADGQTGAATVLDNKETLFAIRIEHCRVAQLVFLDDVPKLQKAASQIAEVDGGLGMQLHHKSDEFTRGA